MKDHLLKKINSESGVIMIASAITLPVIITGVIYTLDSCRLLNRRMNLLHAGDEASLAISTTANYNKTIEEQSLNKLFVNNYLHLYLPDAIKFHDINITTNISSEKIKYNIFAQADFKTYLPNTNNKITLTYGGKADKSLTMGTDYIIAIDASFGPGLNYLSDDNKYVKESKLFIPEFIRLALIQHPENRIAIMPHDSAVPLKLRNINGEYITNERGGPALGCGYLFAPVPEYDLTYAFWSHQPFYRSNKASNALLGSYSINDDKNYQDYKKHNDFNYLTYEIDKLRYEYYEKYVLRQINMVTKMEEYLGTMDQLADGKIPSLAEKVKCDKNYRFGSDEDSNRKTGRYKYSCYTVDDPYSNIFEKNNLDILKREYSKIITARFMQDEYTSLIHDFSIDYNKTVNNLFTLEPIVMKYNWGNRGSGRYNEDYIDHARRNPTFRPFNEVCHSIGWWGHRDRYSYHDSGNIIIKDKNSSMEPDRMVPRNYLIDLTRDIDKLDEFKRFQSFGHKHSGHALLYSTYLARQGNNPRKAILLFDLEFDETWGTKNGNTREVTKKLLRNYKLCEKIKSDFRKYDPSVRRVDIYYIAMHNNSISKEAKLFWQENCVGENNTFDLFKPADMERLKSTIQIGKESGDFS